MHIAPSRFADEQREYERSGQRFVKQRKDFHSRALAEIESRPGEIDAHEFNDRVVHLRREIRPGEES
jgi:hypothetical protein